MIKYKFINKSDDIQKNLKAITQMGIDNFEYSNEIDGILIFMKKVNLIKETEKKLENAGLEYTEFIKTFRLINSKGSYDDKLISKYNNVLKEYKHIDIMKNLSDYKQHLEAFNKPPLQVGTYLNQKRYLDNWEIVKVNFSKKWIDDVFKERNISQDIIDPVMIEINKRESSNKDKELTIGILNNMILKYG